MNAFAVWSKRCLRSRCCRKSRSQPWFATSQSKTKSYPLHRSWRQTMRLVPLCGQCTRWQTAGRPGRYTNAGHRDETHGLAEIRDQFGVCAYDLAEISSTSAPTACRRSVLSFCPQLVGDRPVFLISITHAEQSLAHDESVATQVKRRIVCHCASTSYFETTCRAGVTHKAASVGKSEPVSLVCFWKHITRIYSGSSSDNTNVHVVPLLV